MQKYRRRNIESCLTKGEKIWLAFLPPALAGGFGSIAMGDYQEWYSGLQKAVFTPPNWVFAPVWTLLYLLMGIATYLILRKKYSVLNWQDRRQQDKAIKIYLLQLGLNLLWTVVFFAGRQIWLGLLVLICLLGLFGWMTVIYAKLDKRTLWCLVPNLVWLCLATSLNLMIVILN